VSELPGRGSRVEADPPASDEPGEDAAPTATIDLTAPRIGAAGGEPGTAVTPSIDIRWVDDGACVVELRGRATRAMLAQARDLLWSRKPTDRLTVVVSEAVLTRDLFAMLIAGRRRLSAGGLFEIVGLDAQGARRIADRPLVARRRRP
jgi:hypothetical protein